MQSRPGTYTLIIRYWHEPVAIGDSVLRGSIEHVQTGERVYFQTPEDLTEKLSGYLESQSPTEDGGEPE